jgi:hypothetical protein
VHVSAGGETYPTVDSVAETIWSSLRCGNLGFQVCSKCCICNGPLKGLNTTCLCLVMPATLLYCHPHIQQLCSPGIWILIVRAIKYSIRRFCVINVGCLQHVERIDYLWREFIPKLQWEVSIGCCQCSNECIFECFIRRAKQDDNYGASNIVLPCPGSYIIFHLVIDVVIILKFSM